MKYMKKKKLIAVMALLIIAASFGGCNSANTAATIDPEVTSSEIVSSAPVSSEVTSSEVSSAPVSSEAEKPESGAVSSEAAASSMPEVSSKAEAPAVSSAPATVSQSTVSSAPAAVSKPAAASQPVSSTASSAPVESVAQTSSAPPAQTASAPTQQSGSTKAFEDMTIEEQDQWLLDQLNQQLGSMEVHDSGIVERHSIESTQPTRGAGDDAEHKALEQEKLEQLRQNLQGAQNEQKPKQNVSQAEEQEPESNPTEEQETVSEATGDVYEAIRLINEERVKAGLNELESDSTMMEMSAVRAQEKSVDFSHTRLDGSHWWTIFQDYGMDPGGPGGENGGAGKDTADRQVSSWMKSTAGHKENILEKGITKIGVGYYYSKGSQYGHYWAMITA